jgi:hypothetical protein
VPAPLLGMAPAGGLEVAANGHVPGERAKQVAQRRALIREVNERIHEIASNFGVAERFSILCECVSSECQELFELTQAEYENLRRMPTRFAVLLKAPTGRPVAPIDRALEPGARRSAGWNINAPFPGDLSHFCREQLTLAFNGASAGRRMSQASHFSGISQTSRRAARRDRHSRILRKRGV